MSRTLDDHLDDDDRFEAARQRLLDTDLAGFDTWSEACRLGVARPEYEAEERDWWSFETLHGRLSVLGELQFTFDPADPARGWGVQQFGVHVVYDDASPSNPSWAQGATTHSALVNLWTTYTTCRAVGVYRNRARHNTLNWGDRETFKSVAWTGFEWTEVQD